MPPAHPSGLPNGIDRKSPQEKLLSPAQRARIRRFGYDPLTGVTMFVRPVLFALLAGLVYLAMPVAPAQAEGLSYSSSELHKDCKALLEVREIPRDGKNELMPSYITKRIAGLKCAHYIGGFFDGMVSLAIQTDKNFAACLANSFNTMALINSFVGYMDAHPNQGQLKPYVILSGALRSVDCN